MVLLGVEIGTTSLKAAAFDENGVKLSFSAVDYTLTQKGDFVEFDAEQYWVLFQKGYREAAGDLSPSALAVDTQCETLFWRMKTAARLETRLYGWTTAPLPRPTK